MANLIRDCLKVASMQTSSDYHEQKESLSRQFDYWLGDSTEDSADGGKEAIIIPGLELLVEVGLSKIRRDYGHWLIGKHTRQSACAT
jgi:hypothetical protein